MFTEKMISAIAKKYNDFLYKNIKKINHNPLIVQIEKRGNINRGVLIYEIWDMRTHGAGFFALMNETLKCLYFADSIGATPFIAAWGTQYYEVDGVDGVFNPWEYYFEQYRGMTKADVEHSFMVVSEKRAARGFAMIRPDLAVKSYHYDRNYIQAMARIVAKYIKLNKKTDEQIKGSISKIIKSKRTLGVHIRGGSMLLAPKGHPILPTAEEYINVITEALDKGEFSRIFLATDDERMVRRIREAFPNMVDVYEDVQRAKGEYDVAYINSPREKHRYLCGLEVLRDAYTLVECQGFVSGLSQVSLGVHILKASKGEEWDYWKLIDKGLHSEGKGYEETVRLSKRNADAERRVDKIGGHMP